MCYHFKLSTCIHFASVYTELNLIHYGITPVYLIFNHNPWEMSIFVYTDYQCPPQGASVLYYARICERLDGTTIQFFGKAKFTRSVSLHKMYLSHEYFVQWCPRTYAYTHWSSNPKDLYITCCHTGCYLLCLSNYRNLLLNKTGKITFIITLVRAP